MLVTGSGPTSRGAPTSTVCDRTLLRGRRTRTPARRPRNDVGFQRVTVIAIFRARIAATLMTRSVTWLRDFGAMQHGQYAATPTYKGPIGYSITSSAIESTPSFGKTAARRSFCLTKERDAPALSSVNLLELPQRASGATQTDASVVSGLKSRKSGTSTGIICWHRTTSAAPSEADGKPLLPYHLVGGRSRGECQGEEAAL
jgi:hypothetical protein